jgi:diaminohydroxyphosphoribosylaminopyrimidine deaminase / 5-amino-6-(5-phosphoribosylamino)uracil reductase
MERALGLAALGLGETNPNPVVGCVVVKNGRVVGEGYHQRAGGPHAEVIALEQAGPAARGATAYVTLEPCAHLGKRTPPCAPAVAASGVRRLVVSTLDPNPHVNGRGLRAVRRAGIAVEVGVLAEEARRLNERFFLSCRLGRPFVLLKAAVTLDGRIATVSGHSKWITSPEQRRAARRMRRLYDAVLVGVGTVLADDPLLLPVPRTKRPFVRVVLDSRLRIPSSSQLVRTAGPRAPLWVLTLVKGGPRRARLESRGVTVIAVSGESARVSPRAILRALTDRGLHSVLVEGGGEVLGSFLAARLVDQVALFRAPLLLGGRDSRPAFGGTNPKRIDDALRLRPAGAGRLVEFWEPATSSTLRRPLVALSRAGRLREDRGRAGR